MQNITVGIDTIIEFLLEKEAETILNSLLAFLNKNTAGMTPVDKNSFEQMVSDQIMKYVLRYANSSTPPPLFTAANAVFSSDFVFAEAIGYLLVRQYEFDVVLESLPLFTGVEISEFELFA